MSLGNVSVAILGCQALTYSQRIRNVAAKQKVSQWFSDQKGGYEGWPEEEPVGKNSQDRSPYHSISVTQTQSQDRQLSLPSSSAGLVDVRGDGALGSLLRAAPLIAWLMKTSA